MSEYIRMLSPDDARAMAQVDALLASTGIRRDPHLDAVCGMFDDDGALVATGSCFGPTLRCLAVSNDRQGEGLMNQIIGRLTELQLERGNTHLFLYTKPQSARFFGDLGFYEIARVPGKLVFMENRRTGFRGWVNGLPRGDAPRERTAAVVMNANPFTLGHRWLLEQACAEADAVHLFVLSESFGPIPAADRLRLVREGTADMPKLLIHGSGPYIISAATFPSYFLKSGDDVSETHARLDIAVFARIAEALGIGLRFVGEEPTSRVTALYNDIMVRELPGAGVACRVLPRTRAGGQTISASTVRQAVHDGALEAVRDMLPESTWRYLTGPDGAKAVAAIRAMDEVRHH